METIKYYVSPEGDDSWTGRTSGRTEGTDEGPFRTMERAKRAVRQHTEGEIHVIFHGGWYPVRDTVVFSMEDSGNAGKSVFYENYPGEEPVFSSAVCVEGWEKVTSGVPGLPKDSYTNLWRARFPEGVQKILTVFNGEKALQRCHSELTMPPKNHKYTRTDSLNVSCEEERPLLRRIDFPVGFMKKRENMTDVEIRFMPVPWTMNLLPVADVDEDACIATLAVEATDPAWAKSKGMRVENDIAYLTEPGTWCANSLTREIYYIPEGERPEGVFYVPAVQEYIRVEGQIDYDGPKDVLVENLHFSGFTFLHGMRDTTEDGYKGLGIQHDWEMFDKPNALFRFRGAAHCTVEDCYFHNTSATALRLDLSCQHIRIANNMFDGIGNMGILLCGYGPGTKDENHDNEILNNVITRCGEEIWHGHGIFVWQSGSNLIAHNKIHDSARKAIGLCGVRITILQHPEHTFDEASRTIRWKEIRETMVDSEDEFEKYLPYLHARNNKVVRNEVYRVLEKLGDGSAVNISGAGDGNLIEENYIHHIATYNASGAIRFDDWQRGTTVNRNIIYMCNLVGVVRKNYNDVTNNVLVDVSCRSGYLRFASYPNEKPGYGAKISGNIMMDTGDEMKVFSSGYLVSDGACLPQHCRIYNNLYWCSGNPQCCEDHLKEMKELKSDLEKDSRVADPMFRDIPNGDFDFLPGSPAEQMGIRPVRISEIGLTSDFPKYLLEREYHSAPGTYARGKDPEKQNYAWW